MTHSGGKPHAVGDMGQRYEVRVTGWPKDGDNVMGWSSNLAGAEDLARAARKAPRCTSTTIWDRQEDKAVITQFSGVLR